MPSIYMGFKLIYLRETGLVRYPEHAVSKPRVSGSSKGSPAGYSLACPALPLALIGAAIANPWLREARC